MTDPDPDLDLDPEADRPPLDPADRARAPRPRGFPLLLAGRTWHLGRPGARPAFAGVRDALFADSTLGGRVAMADVLWAGVACLLLNYDVEPAEAVGLLGTAGHADLVAAVLGALFGEEGRERTYSDWVEVSLRANAIDPATVPPEQLPRVLEWLVVAGRAPDPEGWIDAAAAAERFRSARELAAGLVPPPAG